MLGFDHSEVILCETCVKYTFAYVGFDHSEVILCETCVKYTFAYVGV